MDSSETYVVEVVLAQKLEQSVLGVRLQLLRVHLVDHNPRHVGVLGHEVECLQRVGNQQAFPFAALVARLDAQPVERELICALHNEQMR